MDKDEIIDKLKLTPEQLKAFKRMKRALSDFEKLGGKLIGNNDLQYALNRKYFVEACDSYSNIPNAPHILLDEAKLHSLVINDPYSDSPPYVVVR